MKIAQERFVGHFAISIDLNCLRMWDKRCKEPPTFLSRSIYDTIRTNNGEVSVPLAPFKEEIDRMIVELHGRTPRATRPDRKSFAEAVYDALDCAGIEVTI